MSDKLAAHSGEFRDRRREHAFRRTQVRVEIRQIRLIWSLAVVCFALYAPLDHLFPAPGGRLPLALPRLLIILVGGLVLWSTFSEWGRQRRDLLGFLGLAIVAACYSWMLYERGHLQRTPGALLLLVIGIYMFSPGRFSLVCLNGLGCSAMAAAGAFAAGLSSSREWLEYSYLLPANGLAAMALAQLNRTRRRLYQQCRRSAAELRARRRAQRRLALLHRQQQDLLYNALPASIARDLANNPDCNPARLHPRVTVLFADLVGFTELSRRLAPAELLRLLNALFSRFDALAEGNGLEKIKTIGDAYMAVAGLEQEAQQQRRAAITALALQAAADETAREFGQAISLRVGIHSGPVIAGVVGRKRYAFDVWGETVNIASRLQAAAAPGRILVSAATREACPPDLLFGPSHRLSLRGCAPVDACTLYSRTSLPQQRDDQARRRLS